MVLGSLGSLLGRSWALLVVLGAVLGDLGSLLERSWGGLGRSLAIVGSK